LKTEEGEGLEGCTRRFRVLLAEQATAYEEAFMFETGSILAKEEKAALEAAVSKANEKVVKEIFGRLVEKRLKIRNLGHADTEIVTKGKDSKDRFVAYFLEASALAPEGPAAV
jgi:hypothetical protein